PRKSGNAKPPDTDFLRQIREAGEGTSLGQAVWGLAYPDLRRALFPFFIQNDYRDRAEKVEIRWAEYGSSMRTRGSGLRNRRRGRWWRVGAKLRKGFSHKPSIRQRWFPAGTDSATWWTAVIMRIRVSERSHSGWTTDSPNWRRIAPACFPSRS